MKFSLKRMVAYWELKDTIDELDFHQHILDSNTF